MYTMLDRELKNKNKKKKSFVGNEQRANINNEQAQVKRIERLMPDYNGNRKSQEMPTIQKGLQIDIDGN